MYSTHRASNISASCSKVRLEKAEFRLYCIFIAALQAEESNQCLEPIDASRMPSIDSVMEWGLQADISKIPGEILDMLVVNTATLKDNPALGKALTGLSTRPTPTRCAC